MHAKVGDRIVIGAHSIGERRRVCEIRGHPSRKITPPPDDGGGNGPGNGPSNGSCNGVTDRVTQDTKTPRHQDTTLATLERRARDAPAAVPESDADIEHRHDPRVRGALVGGYARRYESAFSRAWMSASKSASDIDLVARWCGSEADPMAAAQAVLDGAFADSWLLERRVPWGPVAKDPARYADAGKGSAKERAEKHLATLRRRLELEKTHGTEDGIRRLQAEYDELIWGSSAQAGAVSERAQRRDGADREGPSATRPLRGLFGAIG